MNNLTQTKIVLRWVAVLPAAVGAYLLTTAVFLLLAYFRLWLTGSDGVLGKASLWVIENIFPVLNDFFSSNALIFTGANIAPSNKKTTALVLMVLFMLVQGMFFGFKFQELHTLDFIKFSAGIFGIIFAYMMVDEE